MSGTAVLAANQCCVFHLSSRAWLRRIFWQTAQVSEDKEKVTYEASSSMGTTLHLFDISHLDAVTVAVMTASVTCSRSCQCAVIPSMLYLGRRDGTLE